MTIKYININLPFVGVNLLFMSYLMFDRTLLTNLERSLDKEMLRTNRAGAYSSTTIVNCNTRKYHGLLVLPVPQLDDNNHVLLSSCDETIVQHGAEFNIGMHKYENDYYAPRGHKYIREFSLTSEATTIYRIGGVVLQKDRVFISGENRILVRYTLLDAHSPTLLRLRPFLAFRNVNELTSENTNANTNYELEPNGVSFCMYDGYPRLVMQTNKQSTWISDPHWYKGIEYAKEQERGYEYKEDLFVPGYFELPIKKGESIILSAGTAAVITRSLKKAFDDELSDRIERTDFKHCLLNSAEQFYSHCDNNDYIIAGYPWLNYRARDQFISLPGVTLAAGNIDEYHKVMNTSIKAIREYIGGVEQTTLLKEIDAADTLLWFVWTVQQYAIYRGEEEAMEKYGDIVLEIVDYIRNQRHSNLFLHDNGLLYANGEIIPATWMNAMEGVYPITPRTGYVVEINTLWYNALMYASSVAKTKCQENVSGMLSYQAMMVKDAFLATFWNGHYLYDFVNGDYKDKEVRPNMILAVSLPFSPLGRDEQKSVVDIVVRELLTVRGLRTLSPKSGMYQPFYVGSLRESNRNYHNGPVWPWLTAPLIDAYLRVYGKSGVSFVKRIVAGMEPEMKELTLGTLSELYDGNPPFKGHGAMSYAMSVGELLRAYYVVENFSKE